MKKLMILSALACAMFATSTVNAAVIRVGVGPIRVGVRTAPIRRAYVAPRPAAIRPAARPAARAVIHHRRHEFWNNLTDALQ